MDILVTLINPISINVFDSSHNATLVVIFILICSLLFLLSLFLLKKRKYLFCLANFTLLTLILITTMYFYNRGYKVIEIRNNGYILLDSIERFRSMNNRLPNDIDEIYAFISSRNNEDYLKVKKTRNYYRNKYDSSNSGSSHKFSLSICDDLLGFDCFVYYDNPIRFELTDD